MQLAGGLLPGASWPSVVVMALAFAGTSDCGRDRKQAPKSSPCPHPTIVVCPCLGNALPPRFCFQCKAALPLFVQAASWGARLTVKPRSRSLRAALAEGLARRSHPEVLDQVTLRLCALGQLPKVEAVDLRSILNSLHRAPQLELACDPHS